MLSLRSLVILGMLPVVACATAAVVPSPDAAAKSGILAYGITLSHRSVIGAVLDSDTASQLRYVRAARISGGKIVPGTTITTDIIHDTIALFAGVAAGEYVITDLVYASTIGSRDSSDHGRITIADSAVKFTVVVLSDEDVRKTAAAAAPGSVCYGGRFAVCAAGSLRDLMPSFDADRNGIRNIVVDKGYAPASNTADDVIAGAATAVARSADDDAYFKTKAAAMLAGSGWEKHPVKTGR